MTTIHSPIRTESLVN